MRQDQALRQMFGRIVSVTTSDGIQLHGFLTEPKEQTLQLWLIVHGVNGNFYSSSLLNHLAEIALSLGHAALVVNTRGHDLASFGSSDTPARMGSMFEAIEDAKLDLAAWIAAAEREGYARIGCMAHSLGAVKVGYSLVQHLEGLERWVALSPPRLNTDLLLKDPAKSQVFLQHLEEAKKWCEEGKQNHILRVRFPLPNWVSAGTFLDKYGSGDKYDYLHWCEAIRIPTLWVFGETEVREGSANFRDADQLLRDRFGIDSLKGNDRLQLAHQVKVIDSADHSYRTQRTALRECISAWIDA